MRENSAVGHWPEGSSGASGAGRRRLGLLAALALVNAAVFQPLVGFHGGEAVTNGLAAWPYFALAAANAAVLFVVTRGLPPLCCRSMRGLLLLAVFTRLAYLLVRTYWGAVSADPDVELFRRYAEALAAGEYPKMEYPQGALALFFLAYLPSSAGIGSFATDFALATLPFELVTIASVIWLGKLADNERVAWAIAAFCAVSPFSLELWYGKFDAAPAALLALGLALFAYGRIRLSAVALAAGFLAKWFPGIAALFILMHLLRARRWRSAAEFAVVGVLSLAVVLVPSWMASPSRFVYAYEFHSSRSLMGESLLYLPVYLFDRARRLAAGAAPWSSVKTGLMTNDLALLLQVAAIGAALAVVVIARPHWRSTVALASIGVTLFVALNRVLSPQYALVLLAAYGVGLVSLPSTRRLASLVGPILVALTLSNCLVWPLWWRYWLVASGGLALTILAIGIVHAHGLWQVMTMGERASSPERSAPADTFGAD